MTIVDRKGFSPGTGRSPGALAPPAKRVLCGRWRKASHGRWEPEGKRVLPDAGGRDTWRARVGYRSRGRSAARAAWRPRQRRGCTRRERAAPVPRACLDHLVGPRAHAWRAAAMYHCTPPLPLPYRRYLGLTFRLFREFICSARPFPASLGGRTSTLRKARRPAGCEPPSAAPDRSFRSQLQQPRHRPVEYLNLPPETRATPPQASQGGPVASMRCPGLLVFALPLPPPLIPMP
jgi:hypothetical protein